jgi:hypothetical protein
MADLAPVLTARPDPVDLDAPVVIDDAPDEPPEPPAASAPAGIELRRPLLLYAISRVVVFVSCIPASLHKNPSDGPWPTVFRGLPLERVFAQWDGAWYLWVADRGYPTAAQYRNHLSEVAFFPLFPAMIRGLATVTRLSTLDTAIILSFLMGAAATVLVWQLAVRLIGRERAARATALFVFFPGAFVLSMAYAETLLILAAAACLLFLLDRRWTLAGIAGLVATATRPNGVAVLIACLVVAIVEVVRRRDWAALRAPLLAACGVGGFFAFLAIRTHHLTAWFQSERVMWHDHFSIAIPVIHRIGGLISRPPTSLQSGRLNDLIPTLGIVFVGLALWWTLRSALPLAVKTYTVAALAIPSLSYAVGPRPRMLFAAFPLAILGAAQLPRRAYNIVFGASVVILVLLTYVTTTTLAAVP